MAAGLAMAASPALAQTASLPPPAQGLARIALKTGKGVITLDLEAEKAPITTRNFLRYIDLRRLDGSTFYRAAKAEGAPEFGVIEGGLQGNPAKVFKPIAFESTIKTGLTHKDGTISMASAKPGDATCDFFIVCGNQPSFDATPDAPTSGFAAFGQVVDGLDLVHQILAMPTDLKTKIVAFRGEMLNPPVPIITARRVVA
jgi:peptidyl-prolyl cis-trans isomerase A (cyclophilin A)